MHTIVLHTFACTKEEETTHPTRYSGQRILLLHFFPSRKLIFPANEREKTRKHEQAGRQTSKQRGMKADKGGKTLALVCSV